MQESCITLAGGCDHGPWQIISPTTAEIDVDVIIYHQGGCGWSGSITDGFIFDYCAGGNLTKNVLSFGISRDDATHFRVLVGGFRAMDGNTVTSPILFEQTITVAIGETCCETLVFNANDRTSFSNNCFGLRLGKNGSITAIPCAVATIILVTATCSSTIIVKFDAWVTLDDSGSTRVAFTVNGNNVVAGSAVQVGPTEIEIDVDSYTPLPGDTWSLTAQPEWISQPIIATPESGTVVGPACILSVDCDGTADVLVTFSVAVTVVAGPAGDASFDIGGDVYVSASSVSAAVVKLTMGTAHGPGEAWNLGTTTPTWITLGTVGAASGTTI